MKYYIALDGGGSKVNAILFDENLKPVKFAKTGSMNHKFSSEELLNQNAMELAHSLMDDTGITEVECAFGVFTRTISDAIGKVINLKSIDDRGGEGLIGLLSAFVFGDAIISLSGTGSVVFYNSGDKGYEAGGWGSIIHDWGSGYDMARMAWNECIRQVESRGPKTLITDCICKKLGVENLWEASDRIYNYPGKAPISALASTAVCVGEAARMGDEIAQRLLKECGEKMAEQTIGLIHRDKAPSEVPIVLEGGHWKNDMRMVRAFCDAIHKDDPQRQVVIPYFEPVVGAVLVLPYINGETLTEQKKAELKEWYKDYKLVIKE